MENPIELRTRRAMGIVGGLIRKWSVEPECRPAHRMEGERHCVIGIDAFLQVLAEQNLKRGDMAQGDDGDFAIRGDIREIELVLRKPDRISILLPEQEVMTGMTGDTAPQIMRMPALYSDIDPADPDLQKNPLRPATDDHRPATYVVTLGKDPFDTFLDPYMAAYSFSQCL